MSKINLIHCDCGNDIERRYHDGLLANLENPETKELELYWVWKCQECGNSWKQKQKESVELFRTIL